LFAACAIVVIAAAACSSSSERTVTVVAASSLQSALDDIAADWTSETGIDVNISYAGSQTLAAQLRDGFPADVAIVAGARIVVELSSGGSLAGEPVEFALNEVVLAFADGVEPVSVADLAGAGLIITLADPAVPLGDYTALAFANAGIDPRSIEAASLETSAAAVVTRLRTGDADAAVIYATDGAEFASSPLGGQLATYTAASIAGTSDEGADFVDYLASQAVRDRLLAGGFIVP